MYTRLWEEYASIEDYFTDTISSLTQNAFNLTMDHALDIPSIASCTTCKFKEDKSNYWTAVLYFKHTNGSFIRVSHSHLSFALPQYTTTGPSNTQSPHRRDGWWDDRLLYPTRRPTSHRFSQGDLTLPLAKIHVVEMTQGFRMITGDPRMRDGLPPDPAIVASWALSFRCWDSQDFYDPSNSFPPGGGQYDTVHLPKKKCNGGIRSNIIFPSYVCVLRSNELIDVNVNPCCRCWNGKDIDPADHTVTIFSPLC